MLKDVDFELREGEVMALMGENGTGKSTLMKILSGVHTDWKGSLELGGKSVRFGSTREAMDARLDRLSRMLTSANVTHAAK